MNSDKEQKKRPQDKWDKKAGVISKTYKVNEKIAEEFKEACAEAGVSMGVQLTRMMNDFIEEVKASE